MSAAPRQTGGRRRALALLGFAAAGLGGWGTAVQALRAATAHPRFVPDDAALQTGDWLFRRTVSLQGIGVGVADPAARFSHVGLIVGHHLWGRAEVVHACPPEHPQQPGVRVCSAAEFVGDGEVRDAAAYRLLTLSTAQRAGMARWARRHIGWDFDAQFSLDAPHALYCTELVRAAMQAVHAQPLPQLTCYATPWGARDVVLPSALLALPEVRRLPHAVRRGDG